MSTKYQETMHFCDANQEERKLIYINIGLDRISMLKGTNENSRNAIKNGINVSAYSPILGAITVSEKMCNYRYANNGKRRIPVELFSDFENGERGWLFTSAANTVFYFFTDAIVSTSIHYLRRYVDQMDDKWQLHERVSSLVPSLIEHGVNGKVINEDEYVEVYISEVSEGCHSVGLMLGIDELPDDAEDVNEYYFEEEPEEEGEYEPEETS